MSNLWDNAIEPYEHAAWGVLIYALYGLMYIGALFGWVLVAALFTVAAALFFIPDGFVAMIEMVKEWL